MSIIDKILEVFLGDKNAKDVKELQKYVKEANEVLESMKSLSNDELRNKTVEFKAKLKEATAQYNAQIDELKKEIESIEDYDEKEVLYNKIDDINKQAYKVEEKILTDILPEAFAVMRETGRRFAENNEVVVAVTEFDRQVAQRKVNVVIDEEKGLSLIHI